MKISRNHVVTLHYQVTDQAGNVVDDGKEPLVYLHGGYGGLFDAMEVALQGMQENDAFRVELSAEQAFGEFDAELIAVEPREAFPPNIQVGTHVEMETDEGESLLFAVTAIDKNGVTIDGNHPLCGKDLIFSGTIAAVRAATRNEIARGEVN